MSLESPASVSPHRCAKDHVLKRLLGQLSRECELSAEFSLRLNSSPVVAECTRCQFKLMRLACEQADEERDACSARFGTYSPEEIADLLLSSQPRPWPPSGRWPELEALADPSVSRQRLETTTKLTATLRHLVTKARGSNSSFERVLAAWSHVRRAVRERASSADLGMAACLANDMSLLAAAFRQANVDEGDDGPEATGEAPSAWEVACDALGDLSLALISGPRVSEVCVGQLSESLTLGHSLPRAPKLPRGVGRRSVRHLNPRIAFRFARSIDSSVSRLDQLEDVATRVCSEVVEKLRYTFAGVSLVRIDDGTIEAIAGSADAAHWVGRVRHPIHPDLPLSAQDIQCHVVLNCCAELVKPDDPRLDPFVKDHFGHKVRRYFIPLLVAYDTHGHHVEDSRRCEWKVDDTQPWRLCVAHSSDITLRVFGTLEVGIKDGAVPTLEEFLRLANWSLQKSFDVYGCTLDRVFDTIITTIRSLARADKATLHHGRREPRGIRWDASFTRQAGEPTRLVPASEWSSSDNRLRALGEAAIDTARPQMRAPGPYEASTASILALPILAGVDVGTVLLHSSATHTISESELEWLSFLAERASAAIRMARAYADERDRRFQLIGQLKTAKAMFEHTSPDDLDKLLTNSTLNLSSADVALLYRISGDAAGPTLLCRAGRRLASTGLDEHVESLVDELVLLDKACLLGPELLVHNGADALLHADGLQRAIRTASRFTEAERATFLGVLPLRDARSQRAVLVLVYRRATEPQPSEQRQLELFASTACLALDFDQAAQVAAEPTFRSHVGHVLDAGASSGWGTIPTQGEWRQRHACGK